MPLVFDTSPFGLGGSEGFLVRPLDALSGSTA
jgi:hypothetical protein